MRPLLKVVDEKLSAQIVADAKDILSQIGIEVRGAALRQRLLDHGLKVDSESGHVLFPPDVVDAALASAPRSFTLYDREGAPAAQLGGDAVHFVPGSSGLKVLDYRSGETRLANTRDFVEYVRLTDGLEHIAYLATAFSTNDDISAAVADAWRLYLCLTNSVKPVVSGAFTAHGVPRMGEMMALFRHDRADLVARPLSIFTITATGNFRYGEDSCQNLLDCVEWGIPIEIVPVTLMGLIAPVTPVGATVFHTADVLAGLTMSQIVKPGAPVLFGGAPATFHMRTATSPMAAIEALQLILAYVDVAKWLELPTQAYLALSEAKFVDAQAGAETFGGALLAALAGINSVSGPGMLDYLLVFSLEKLVLDNALCGQALHLAREVQPVDDLPAVALARALLEEQHLLTTEHTMTHWEETFFLPGPVIDRDNRENWARAGSKELPARAREEVARRLAAYEPVITDESAVREMQRLLRTGSDDERPLPEVPSAAATAPARAARRGGRERRQTRRRG